ncbi:leucine--tRNA ligase [Candidatus Margulisiibacteriota bacterium]
MEYKPLDYEEKWLQKWEQDRLYYLTEDPRKKNYYVLEMFPYPSGKLHMGHVRNYAIGDTLARYKKMKGYNVLHPMGYDSLGLPAENAAIKHQVHPEEWTLARIEEMKEQQKRLGLSYDWDRIVTTCLPEYYHWNQWIFIKMYEKGLAYKKKAPVNWCGSCNTVLANEQVENDKCWRCKSIVEAKDLEQWFFKITDYADELLKDLKKLDGWPDKVKLMQENWIGKSIGVEIDFQIKDTKDKIRVYTTRPDTVYGITYMVLAPEHSKVKEWIKDTEYETKVLEYIEKIKHESRGDRIDESKVKEGVFTGKYFISPFTGEAHPIWVSDYVLMEYGTGAVMAVPAHDQRDFEFAKKNNLPIKVVIQPEKQELSADTMDSAYLEPGIMVNSAQFNKLTSLKFKEVISDYIEENNLGVKKVNFKLRDWLLSRQRYWGTPIPMIYCEKCGIVPEKEENLPVELPKNIQFTGQGNPLDKVTEFVNCVCPKCGAAAYRETDTMDTFVDSSWYFLRYLDPKATNLPFNKEKAKNWMPVNQYIGGVEHAVMHLLYARFFTKILRDIGLVSLDEPFEKLLTQGMVIKDGAKMSKSIGNTVDPGLIINKYGADTARIFILFGAPVERDLDWSDTGVEGCFRFLGRVFRIVKEKEVHVIKKEKAVELEKLIHKTIKKVSEDIERFSYNTAISKLMEFVNFMYLNGTNNEALKTLVHLIAPFAPFLAEELWQEYGKGTSVHLENWPEYNAELVKDETLTIVISVNGKVRDRFETARDTNKEELETKALARERILNYTDGKQVIKVIVVPNKLVNIVIK